MNQNRTFHCTSKGVFECTNNANKRQYFTYYPKLVTLETDMLQTQLYGNKHEGESAQDWEDNRYSDIQNKLYQQCLFGIKSCSADEIKKMSFQEKSQIQYKHKRTQQLINLSKWKKTTDFADAVIKQSFATPTKNFQWLLDVTKGTQADDNAQINMSPLKSIGGKDGLIKAMIKNELLPSNFHKLKPA